MAEESIKRVYKGIVTANGDVVVHSWPAEENEESIKAKEEFWKLMLGITPDRRKKKKG